MKTCAKFGAFIRRVTIRTKYRPKRPDYKHYAGWCWLENAFQALLHQLPNLLWAFWEQPLRGPGPHVTYATNNPDYIFLWHSKPAPDDRWASSKALQLARVHCNCPPQHHARFWRLLLSFPKRKWWKQLCTNCVIHESYVSQRLANICFVPNPICHSPTGGRLTVTMPAPHLSFI